MHAGRDEHSGQYRYVTKTVRGTRREAERELARLVANVDDGVATSTAGRCSPSVSHCPMTVFSHAPAADMPWQPNYVTRAFGRLATELDLDGLRLHDLRHFAATTMLINGIDVRTAAGRLGHAQTSTTLDTYAHFIQAADQRAAAAIGDVLDAPASGASSRSSTRRASRHA